MSDPLLREAEARLMASREVRSQARSVLFPEIDANADYSRQDSRATLLFYAPTPTRRIRPHHREQFDGTPSPPDGASH